MVKLKSGFLLEVDLTTNLPVFWGTRNFSVGTAGTRVDSQNVGTMPHVSPSKQDHVSPLLHSLRSLPVTQIIDCLHIVFRVLLCCERYRSGLLACPNCGASTTLLANSVLFLIPDCLESLHSKLRQTDTNMFRIKLQLAIWTKLPETIRYSESMSSLKSGLKPHLVKQ